MTAHGRRRTQVAIIGAGPAGLVTANILAQSGIDCVVIERRSREHVLNRARAGLIEHRTVELLGHHGLARRLLAEGTRHDRCEFRHRGRRFSVPYGELAGGLAHYVYPQQLLVRDLLAEFTAGGGTVLFSRPVVELRGTGGPAPVLVCAPEHGGGPELLECDLVAGCDGGYGVSRPAVPASAVRVFATRYEFNWLAVLAAALPSTAEIVYALHPDGFAGHMLRTPAVSRYYLQCPSTDIVEDWPDERIWDELRSRLAVDDGWRLTEGPVIEKGVLEMRSAIVEPMQHGRLFLLGDAAHVLTPAGAKGMNLAIADAEVFTAGVRAYYHSGDERQLKDYSDHCLPRIWRAQEFSHWLLGLIHTPAATSTAGFERRIALARLAQLRELPAYATAFAAGYVGRY